VHPPIRWSLAAISSYYAIRYRLPTTLPIVRSERLGGPSTQSGRGEMPAGHREEMRRMNCRTDASSSWRRRRRMCSSPPLRSMISCLGVLRRAHRPAIRPTGTRRSMRTEALSRTLGSWPRSSMVCYTKEGSVKRMSVPKKYLQRKFSLQSRSSAG
jgi:hypothetical protein